MSLELVVLVLDRVGLHLVVDRLVVERLFVEAHLLRDLLAVEHLRVARAAAHAN